MTLRPHSRLTELDSLRGIAAMLVMLFHYTCNYVEITAGGWTHRSGIWWGFYGVQLFFAISGFVIYMSLERSQRASDFIVSRFSRLFPTFWAAMLITTIVVTLTGDARLKVEVIAILANVTMLPSVFNQPPVDAVYWSLAVELQFYFFIFLLHALGQFHRIERWLVGWIMLGLLGAHFGRVDYMTIWQQIAWFALGIGAYRIWTGARRWQEQMPLFALGTAAAFAFGGIGWLVTWAIVAALLALLISQRLMMLRHPLLLWFGAISYPLYLVHQYVGYALFGVMEKIGMARAPMLVAATVVVLTLAWLLHVLVERPSQRWLRDKWRRTADPNLTTAAKAAEVRG
jgi:peptidoglycan/LPS O-acetylase OafA/YrhL